MRQVENLSGLVEGLKALAADMREDAARFAAYTGTTVEALRALPENDRPAINEKWRAWVEAGKPAADIIGTANPFSGRITMKAATPLGVAIIKDAAREIYGDETVTTIPYETLACEGAYVVAQMARRGAVVQLPHYTLHGAAEGDAALDELG